jgi:hypothetical protein
MRAAILYTEWLPAFEELTMEQRGQLVTLILQYTAGMEVTPPEDLRLMWAFVRASIDTNAAKFEAVREKRAAAGRKHKGNQYTKKDEENLEQMEQMEQNGTNGTYQYQYQYQNQEQSQYQYQGSTSVEHINSARETAGGEVVVEGRIAHAPAPNADEVVNYFAAINGTEEQARRFFDYWETENWTKKSGQRLIAWQAAARQWVLDDYRKNQEKQDKNGRDKRHQLASAGEYTSEF